MILQGQLSSFSALQAEQHKQGNRHHRRIFMQVYCCASVLLRKYTAAAIAATAGAGWTGAQADGAHKGSDARQQQPGDRLPRRALAV